VMNQRAVAVAILAASVGLPFAALVYFYWRDWPYAVAVLVGALIALRGEIAEVRPLVRVYHRQGFQEVHGRQRSSEPRG
jgi:hypothetical protein